MQLHVVGIIHMAESLLCFAGLLTHRLSYGMNAMDLKDIHLRKLENP
jgi:hypothetical protein